MHLEVNGEAIEVAATNLADLLTERGFDAASVATALNGDFVPAPARAASALGEGAKVEVLAPMQGG